MRTALPVLSRELRAASRRKATYLSRFQTALAGVIPTAFLLFGALPAASPAQMGAQMFYLLSGLAFLFAMLGAVRLPSDSLSAEKREGTLGFLFLTDLTPFDVVVGKLAASSLNVLYGLMALLPLVAIPMLCGGVTLGDFLRLTVACLNALFFALSVAMLVSAFCWQSRTAAGMTFLALFTLGGALPMTLVAVTVMNGASSPTSALGLPCPLFTFLLVPDALYAKAPWAFWISAVLTHGMGWFFLWLCCRVLPRVWQDRPAEKRRLRLREWYRNLILGTRNQRQAFRRWALSCNPIFWLGSREIRLNWYPWVFLGSLGFIIGCSSWGLRVGSVEWGALLTAGFVLHGFFKYWLATLACHAFSADRDHGALELLFSTPVSVPEMLKGHALTLRRIFLGPLLLLVVLECAGAIVSWRTSTSLGEMSRTFACLLVLAGIVVFVADLFALSWVGWWMGAISKNAGQAMSGVCFRIFFLPIGGAMFLAVAANLLMFLIGGNNVELPPGLALAFYVGASLGADWWFGRQARRKLFGELRTAAAERYGRLEAADGRAFFGAAWRWWRRLASR